MGYRDFFFLDRKSWRLIENTQSLFHIMYKAHYFPNRSFMMAELGNNPLFAWRSILAASDIIKEGTRWKVCNGRKIGVFTHGWLSHSPVPLNEVSRYMQVCEVIDQDTRQWDRGKIFATFAHHTQVEILAIPPNNPNSIPGHLSVEGE